jgi:GDPmannose 4,6-dehydratase
MKKKALILGVDGQDGSLMSDFLVKKKYKIIGTYRDKKLKKLRSLNILNKIKVVNCDISNFSKINNLIKKNSPDEIYNFAGVSTLNKSENNLKENDQTNNQAVLNIMLSIKDNKKKIKFFQSLSSEMFKKNKKINFCNEKTKLDINNAYSISKISSYNYLKLLRKKYKLKLYAGFLFNHASYFSKNDFLIKKIVEDFLKLKDKKIKKITWLETYMPKETGFTLKT